MYFILDPHRLPPERHRVTDNVVMLPGKREYAGGYTENVLVSTGESSSIYDSSSPRYSWKDVVHDKITHEPLFAIDGLGINPCNAADPPTFTNWSMPHEPVMSFQEIVAHPDVQRAAANVARRWYDKLYQIRPEQLPDMFVFLAEIKELGGVFSIILGFARQIITLFRALRNKERTYRRLIKSVKDKKQRRALKNDLVRATRSISNDILSLRFGVMAPIRDITKIISALYGYIDMFNFLPRTEAVREIVKLHVTDGVFFTGCSGYTCPGGIHTLEAPCVDDIEVELCATAHFRNELVGTKIEKLFAVLMQQVGVLPSLDSMWELTKLSWLIDYFFATEKILGRLERATSHCGFVRPIVMDSCVSLHITRRSRSESRCGAVGSFVGAIQDSTNEHYERMSGDGHDLLTLVNWIRNPAGGQLQNAVAFLLQLATGKH